MNDKDLIKKFFKEYHFSDEEKMIIASYKGKEVDMLYNCFINTDIELTNENLYKVFRLNFLDCEDDYYSDDDIILSIMNAKH